MAMLATIAAVVLTCTPLAIDGDTLRCGAERIRLLGIDAPEMPGHCHKPRICVDGDPYASKASLADALRAGPYVIRRVGTDRYGRTLATVTAQGKDLSCAQLRAGSAIYVDKWDNGHLVADSCPN